MKIEILGNVQDGGVPHLGCDCNLCEKARKDCNSQKYNSSILITDGDDEDSFRYLVEPTPDVRYQINGEFLDGVFISHGHLGHITGLLHFGEEALDVEHLPVYVSDKTRNFITSNDPYRLLTDRDNIKLMEFNDGETTGIQGGKIEATEAQHNRLNTDTLGFTIHGENKKLFYLSDIHTWTETTLKKVKEADIAIVDGTFWNEEEIERYEEVPHPVMKETMHKTEDWNTQIIFTHLNHTNPALREDTEEREELEERGFKVAEKGMEIEL